MAATATTLMPSEADLLYEEDVLRDPHSLRPWRRYLAARAAAPPTERALIYERAVRALPGSYKLWHDYLVERAAATATHPAHDEPLNRAFERALATLHRMPRIWEMYLAALLEQRVHVTRARRAFDRALRALPVTQHHRVWPLYLRLAALPACPAETSIRIYRRFVQFDPTRAGELVDVLVSAGRWQEAAEHIVSTLDNGGGMGDAKRGHVLRLCDLLAKHADEIAGLKVEAVFRSAIRVFPDEAGKLRVLLAECYVRRGLHDKARDVLEEGVTTAATAAEFGLVFESYAQLEQSLVAAKLEESSSEEGGDNLLAGCWLADNDDADLPLARLERLLDRRPELLSGVLLRQNPHDVEQWHRRVKLFDKDPARQAATYAEAVRTVDPAKAAGKAHTLWVAFARMYEAHGRLDCAEEVFEKATRASHKSADDLAAVWCEWVEMELRHKSFDKAIALTRKATAATSTDNAAATDADEPARTKLHRSPKLWRLHLDLEESLGTLASTCAAYERAMDLRVATPQTVLNYASFLEEHKRFEDSFAAYERGVNAFKHPHCTAIWETYLDSFVRRHGETKTERARELFAEAIRRAPPEEKKRFLLRLAAFEEELGSPARAMGAYAEAARSAPSDHRAGLYELYAARAAALHGVAGARLVYEQAVADAGLPDGDALAMCVRFAELEEGLGEVARARAVLVHGSSFADPDGDRGFWETWSSFEVRHGDERTFGEMLRIKRTLKHGKSSGGHAQDGAGFDEFTQTGAKSEKKRCVASQHDEQLGSLQLKRQRV